MVTFLPFRGHRPFLGTGEDIGARISPPYDVIDSGYLKELQAYRCNVTRLTLSPDDNGRYIGSRKELEKWIADGSLVQDDDSFYLYEQEFTAGGKKMVRRGIVGILRTEPYENGNIIPHEETFSKVKEDRLNLLRDMETHLESIFGIFGGFSAGLNIKIDASSEKLYRYTDECGVIHTYRKISDKAVTDAMVSELSEQKMLIADGHHRYETALSYSIENPDDEKKGFVLATLVASDDPGLVIWPTHRLLDSPLDEKDAVGKIKDSMTTADADTPDDLCEELPKWQMGLIFGSGKCMLARYDGPDDGLRSLDTYAAQELVIGKTYGYDAGTVKVSYDAEFGSVVKKMRNGTHDAAIVLNAPDLRTVWDLSAAGRRMPKKTTYFFPKIWSGFVFYKMG